MQIITNKPKAVTLILVLMCLKSLGAMAQKADTAFASDSISGKNFPVIATFKSGLIINCQSNETLHKHDLLVDIAHRFGDIAGANGGVHNFYGLDNSTDIYISFKYGITDRFTIGAGRAKGAPNGVNTFQKELYNLSLKYRLLQQTTDNRMPVSVTLYGNTIICGMEPLDLATSDADFQKFGDRLSFTTQAIISRKFNSNFSLALLPTYIRRNYVSFMDMNNMFALGVAGRFKFTKRMAIVADYTHSFRSSESKDYYKNENDFTFYNALGVGLEIETGGHVFNLSFTNSTAILESQFVPSTSSSWTSGQFRWGFNISRTFTLKRDK
ncbi:DUF5777 family beta-barrel protein [Solitalea lacus]|uniref:DUF5777 family beta-barrel protein n=1 Tax=Solitalea lacus TaxID=2911172 RepID=UPI001EDB1314|nr:DUF5777 family beta-barrel protein [Solitalea lacus]UKJ07607.1 DUF5777 family beta-barrel protein [Solitalea lacus]